ncbi:MAG: ATP-binding cassette domain-containing protein, partial [Desulfobulbaceae bacterium]|nr:ATP-binding cassette domain-containing protein [Desulfobulbaceae bacterium]
YALYPHMTVYQNMAFGLKMRGVAKTVIRQRVSEAAGILGLNDLLDRKSKALSGGQQQRVALGRAIVRQPRLFLFDEPLSNLDARLRIAMRGELIRLHKRLDATMIYVTHDQVEAMSLGERLVVLKDGAVQQIGAPLDIYQCPVNRFVAGFIGTPPMNFFPCTIKGTKQTLRLVGKECSLAVPTRRQYPAGPAILPDQEVILGIRPEDIHEEPHNNGAATEQMVTARVEFLETMGSEVLATCRLGNVEFITRLPPQTKIRATEEATLFFDMNRAHLFHSRTGESLR